MKLSRKDFLRLGLAGGAGLFLPFGVLGCGGLTTGNNSAQGSAGALLKSSARLPEPFTISLHIPPVLEPVHTDASAEHYEITQKVGQAEILLGLKTEVWGYDGIFPGPTIESRRGRQTVIRHRNEGPLPTVVHLHGGKTPPEHDGYLTDIVMPVGSRESRHGNHGGHVKLNVSGEGIFERDVPWMICDRAFTGDGTLDYPSIDPSLKGQPGVEGEYMSVVLGDCILVNGAPWPVLEVTNTLYRFRLVNAASNARRYRLALDPPPQEGTSFAQIGSDGGLLAKSVNHDKIEMAQAERFDVIVDFSNYPVGTEVTLVNEFGVGSTTQIMRFVVARKGTEESHIPPKLIDFQSLSKSDATVVA